jgi:hypothetical protein
MPGWEDSNFGIRQGVAASMFGESAENALHDDIELGGAMRVSRGC